MILFLNFLCLSLNYVLTGPLPIPDIDVEPRYVFPAHMDFQKVGETTFNNEKYNVLRPTTHFVNDYFKDTMLTRDTSNFPTKRVFVDRNGFRHYWSGVETKLSMRKGDGHVTLETIKAQVSNNTEGRRWIQSDDDITSDESITEHDEDITIDESTIEIDEDESTLEIDEDESTKEIGGDESTTEIGDDTTTDELRDNGEDAMSDSTDSQNVVKNTTDAKNTTELITTAPPKAAKRRSRLTTNKRRKGKGRGRDIGRRMKERGCDPRSKSFLVQRIAIAIQRANAASVMGTFAPGTTRGGIFD